MSEDAADTAGGERALAAVRLRLVESIDEPADRPAGEQVANALRQIEAGIDALEAVDPDGLDQAEYRAWLEGLERSRRAVEAATVAAAAHVDGSNPFRDQGFFSARTVLTHMLQLSGPEAHRRLQTARMHRRLPDWADAELDGGVGVAQSELMARVVANPRVPSALLDRDAPDLLADARRLSFDEFERHVRTWEALADPDGDRSRRDLQHANRFVSVRPRPEGGWSLAGQLGELDGCEFMEIFSWFVEAEWQGDWAEARDRLGDHATASDLARTASQREADALMAMARAAASAPVDARRPKATVNVLIDHESWEAHLRGEPVDPARYRQVVCRAQSGRRLHPDDAVNTALTDHVRRVVFDSAGTVIDLGRRSRLFRGAAREATMLLATQCAWIGCDRPIDWCDADHSRGWKAHGATVPRNGTPLCGAHNRFKERGFRVHRDANGEWHVVDPDGDEIT